MPLKSGLALAATVDLAVGVFDGRTQGFRRGTIHQLMVAQRHGVDGQFAGQLARRVGPHAVGHHEQVPPLLKGGLAAGDRHRQGILVVGTPQAQVAEGHMLQIVLPSSLLRVHEAKTVVQTGGGG